MIVAIKASNPRSTSVERPVLIETTTLMVTVIWSCKLHRVSLFPSPNY